MPLMMKFIVVGGIMAPFVIIASVLTGQIAPNHISSSSFGAADNIFELILVLIFSVPIMCSAFLLVMKIKVSRYVYVSSWILICGSPLVLPSVRSQLDIFLVSFFINVFIGLVIGGYFLISKEVKRYFE
jgi:hypothetical protein